MTVSWHRQQHLDDGFATLVVQQRLQDELRHDLERRERDLRDREQSCLLLEEHLAGRLQTLVSGLLLLERAVVAELGRVA